MYIAELRTRNFRSLKDCEIKFRPGLNVIVGKNNSGKSNILRALADVLDARSEHAFDHRLTDTPRDEEDLYFNDSDGKAKNYLVAVKLQGAMRPKRHLDGSWSKHFMRISRLLYGQMTEECEISTSRTEVRTGYQLKAEVHEIWLYHRKGVNGPKVCIELKTCDGVCFHWHQSRPGVHDMLLWPLLSLFETTCHIGTKRDEEQLWRVLNQIVILPMTELGALSAKTNEEAKAAADKAFGRMSAGLSAGLASTFTSKVRLGLKNFEFDQKNHVMFESKHLDLELTDEVSSSISQKGDGVLSSLVIDGQLHWRSNANILLLDEPENFLHPHSQRLVIESLNKLTQSGERPKILPLSAVALGRFPRKSNLRGIRNRRSFRLLLMKHRSALSRIRQCKCLKTELTPGQVILITHAPSVLRECELDGLILTKKDKQSKSTKIVHPGNTFDRIIKERWSQLIRTRNGEMVFADHVILVEGGEEFLIPKLAGLFLGEHWLNENNVSIIRAEGKGNFSAYHEILTGLGIGVSILTDVDFLVHGLDKFRHLFDGQFELQRGQLVAEVTRIKSGSPAKAKHVKGVIHPGSRDWANTYAAIRAAVNDLKKGVPAGSERIAAIDELWNKLEDTIDKKGFKELVRDFQPEIGKLVNELIEKAKEQQIFIIPEGELEDCYTTPLPGSKDQKAMEAARIISMCVRWDDAKSVINNPIFFEGLFNSVVDSVKQRAQ